MQLSASRASIKVLILTGCPSFNYYIVVFFCFLFLLFNILLNSQLLMDTDKHTIYTRSSTTVCKVPKRFWFSNSFWFHFVPFDWGWRCKNNDFNCLTILLRFLNGSLVPIMEQKSKWKPKSMNKNQNIKKKKWLCEREAKNGEKQMNRRRSTQ